MYSRKEAQIPRSYTLFSVPATTKHTHCKSKLVSTPVILGPANWASVLTTLTHPKIAVLCDGLITVVINTFLGATSICCVMALIIKITIVTFSELGAGTNASAMDDGR